MKTDTPYRRLRCSALAGRRLRLAGLALCVWLHCSILWAAPVAPVGPEQSVPAGQLDGPADKTRKASETTAPSWWSTVIVVPDLDAYYSSLGLHIPLTDAPIPDMGTASEGEVYRQLFLNSLHPRFLLLEASVFPMPLVGVGFKKYTPEFYRAAGIGKDFNLIESVTTGFPEPYAATLFVGDIVDFVKPGEKQVGANKGYMGYLFSYSNQHIRRNTLIPDNNYELEWKLKGERNFPGEHLSWSFRIGAKLHDNPEIQNTLYLGIRRNNVSVNAPFLAWLDNSNLQMRLDFSQSEPKLLRQEYIIGKSYPLKKWQAALSFDVGIIWESPDLYRGQLRYLDRSGVTLVLRPNIEF